MGHVRNSNTVRLLSRLFIFFLVDVFTNSSTFESEKVYNCAKEVFNTDLILAKPYEGKVFPSIQFTPQTIQELQLANLKLLEIQIEILM